MKSFISCEDEYPIVWYQPSNTLVAENNSIHLFCEFEEMLRFCKSLDQGFLLIVPYGSKVEENLLKELKNLKGIYKRRLADFEEESAIAGISKETPEGQSLKIFVFYTKEAFESEALTKEILEKAMGPLSEVKMTESAKDFVAELISCESDPKDQLSQPDLNEVFTDKDHMECREWCINGLKGLTRKKDKERMKMIYYVILAESQKKLNKNNEALELYKKILATFRNIYREAHPSTAAAYYCLGTVYLQMRNNESALDYFFKALNIRKSLYGETHESTANTCSRIAAVYKQLEDYQKAVEFHTKAVGIQKKIYGETDSKVAQSYYDIASAYDDLEIYPKALEYYSQALKIRKLNNEEKLVCTADIYSGMGSVYFYLEEAENAAECLTKALEIRKSIHGENHSEVLRLYNSFAAMYSNFEDYDPALQYNLKALRIVRFLEGEINPEIEVLYRDISEVYDNLGYGEKAAEYFRKSLSVRVALRGEIHAEVADAYHDLALKYEYQDKSSKALHYYLKALSIFRVTHGENDPSTEAVYESIENNFGWLKNYEKEMICDQKSILVEKSVTDELVVKGGKIIVYEKERNGRGDFADFGEDEEEDFEARNDSERNSILGKRCGSAEDSWDENSEPEVEKKIKQ